jgi:hypothetical protein
MNAKSRFSFKAYLKEGTSAPVVSERYTGNPWVYFGADNLFLENMRTLADNCVPLQRCVEMAAMFIAGKGIKFYDQEGNEIPAAQAKFQEWMKDTTEEEFLYATALDIALANAKSWVLRRGFGGALVRVDHLDVVRLRSGKLTDGKITDYYWSSDWNKIGPRGGSVEDRYRPITLPAFTTERKEAKSVMYSKTYKQNRDYYGEPWYLAAVQDCEVWAKVPNFNKVQIDTGFRASVHLHTFINADTKDLEQYDKDIENAYTGSNGRGIFHTFGMPEEGAPQLTALERGDHAGELDTIRDNAEKVIVRAYGIPDILYRMDTSGGLSSQGSALKAALEQFQTTFVEPKQQIICRDLVRLMNEEGIEVWEAEIEGLEVFEEDTNESMVRLRSMTINELRDEMDMPPLDDQRGDIIPGLISQPMTADLAAVPAKSGNTGPMPFQEDQADPANMDAPEDTPNPEDE